MRCQRFSTIFALATLLFATSAPAFPVSKEMIQLQTQVQLLADNMAKMQQSFDERMGIMRNLIEQDSDNVNKLSVAVQAMQKTLQQQNLDSQQKVDQVSAQVQSLNDSIDELKARLARVSKQLEDMQQQQQNLTAPPGPGAQGAPAQAPPPGTLYDNALRDYTAGRYDLAMQQFADYVKYYPATDLAGNAQYYVADIEYRQGNFQAAVNDYDKVLELYPGGNKAAAAQLKKGFALLELGQKDAGVRELNALVGRYPKSIEAQQARDRLRKLGVTVSPATAHSTTHH